MVDFFGCREFHSRVPSLGGAGLHPTAHTKTASHSCEGMPCPQEGPIFSNAFHADLHGRAMSFEGGGTVQSFNDAMRTRSAVGHARFLHLLSGPPFAHSQGRTTSLPLRRPRSVGRLLSNTHSSAADRGLRIHNWPAVTLRHGCAVSGNPFTVSFWFCAPVPPPPPPFVTVAFFHSIIALYPSLAFISHSRTAGSKLWVQGKICPETDCINIR